MSNSFPKVAAFGGTSAVLGTNPLAFAAPRASGGPVLLDMATSQSSGSAVRWGAEDDWRVGDGAEDRLAASVAEEGGVVLEPFGGAKGFGLGLMVEILAGALTGAGVSTEVRSMYRDFEHGGNNGHLVITLDIGQWMSLPAFHDRMERLLCAAESSGESASHRVRLPGQARWDAVALTQSEGLRISARVAETLDTLASRLGIATPW